MSFALDGDKTNMMRQCWQRGQKIDRDEIKERRRRTKKREGDGECGGRTDR